MEKTKKPYFDLAILILRIYLGVSMVKMSCSYLFDKTQLAGLASFLESLNWPFPIVFAYSSQIIELISGILILLGFRIGGILLFLVLSSAVIFAHGFRIFDDAMLPMNFAIMALMISILGCGRYSLEFLFYSRKNKS